MSDFLKQGKEPLFPKILWNRPINKRAAKRLLIIGGQAKQFQQTQNTYQAALDAGIGSAKVVLPDAIRTYTGDLPDCLFVPSTRAGSIAKSALEPIRAFCNESDGVLLAGELSRNAQTLSLLESLLDELTLPVTITEEVIDSLLYRPQALFSGSGRLLIAGIPTLVKLAEKLQVEIEITSASSLINQIELLDKLSFAYPANYAAPGRGLIVKSNGQTSVTQTETSDPARIAAYLATYWLQHRDSFQALTSGAHALTHDSD